MSLRRGGKIYLAPTGVQKEMIKPDDIFILDEAAVDLDPTQQRIKRVNHNHLEYDYRPAHLRPSACTPLFLASYRLRGANCCIHTHSQWAVLVTLIIEKGGFGKNFDPNVFEIARIEQIKGIPRGRDKPGNLQYNDTLRVPIISNTLREEELTGSLEMALAEYPDAPAVLVRRHGIYVWGKDVAQAKTTCECLDYLFQLAVQMNHLGIAWTNR